MRMLFIEERNSVCHGGGGEADAQCLEHHSLSSLSGARCYFLAASLQSVFSYFADPNNSGKIPLYVKSLV